MWTNVTQEFIAKDLGADVSGRKQQPHTYSNPHRITALRGYCLRQHGGFEAWKVTTLPLEFLTAGYGGCRISIQ